jgi:hypothetical protein
MHLEPLTTAVFPWYSVIGDTGTLVAALIRAEPGQTLIGVNEWLSIQDINKLIAQSMQKRIDFEKPDAPPSFGPGDPELERDRTEMLGFCLEFGYDGGSVDKTIVKPENLGVPVQLKPVREWVNKQDWEKILPAV